MTKITVNRTRIEKISFLPKLEKKIKEKSANIDSVVQLNANVLKQLRIKRRYTLQELSSLSGLSTSYISRLEAGERRMNTEIIHKLALALGCDAEIFFKKEVNLSDFLSENGYIKDVPVYRVVSAGAGINTPYDVIFTNEPMLYIFRLPQFVSDENVFATYCINDNYAPKFEAGDLLYFKKNDCKINNFVMLIDKDNCINMGKVIELSSSIITLKEGLNKEISYSYSSIQSINVLLTVICNAI